MREPKSIAKHLSSGGNFRNKDLSGVDLSGQDLSGADLERTKLWRASFVGANLERANLRLADLGEANFREANLAHADLSIANLWGAKFDRTILADARLEGANLKDAELTNSDLQRADLNSAGVDGAKITKIQATDANIWGVDFRSCELLTHVQADRLCFCHQSKYLWQAGKLYPSFVDLTTTHDVAAFLQSHPPFSDFGDLTNPPTVFVIMMFGNEELDSAYRGVIQTVIKDHGLSPLRIDEVQDSGSITDQVLEKINSSRYVYADLTGERPNCYYECGYAYAIGKELILTIKKGKQPHFDLARYRFIQWSTESELRDKLNERFNALMEREPKNR